MTPPLPSSPRTGDGATPKACVETRQRLRTLERDAQGENGQLPRVRAHLDACPPCAERLAARCRRLEARAALRSREAPDALFHGFFEAVQERVAYAPAGGGLSSAFLDAPRALRMWRATALAAMIVVGVGTGYVLSQSGDAVSGSRAAEQHLRPVPERLVPAWRGSAQPTWPVADPAERYFQVQPVSPAAPASDAGTAQESWD